MLDSTSEQTSFSSGQNGHLERYGARTYIYVLPLERETVEAIMLKTLVLLKTQ